MGCWSRESARNSPTMASPLSEPPRLAIVDDAAGKVSGQQAPSPHTVVSDTAAEPRAKRLRHAEHTGTTHAALMEAPLTVVIFGATGDLAKKKLFPSLYQLCLQGHLPRHLNIVGYGRSAVDLPAFIEKQCINIRDKPESDFSKEDFCKRISFHAGGYDAASSYTGLDEEVKEYEGAHPSGMAGNRLFFLSVPPTVFGVVAEMISRHARAQGGFTRLMIEKPFGKDSASFEALNQLTAAHFAEWQVRPRTASLSPQPRFIHSPASFTAPPHSPCLLVPLTVTRPCCRRAAALPPRPLSRQGSCARHTDAALGECNVRAPVVAPEH